MRNNYIEILKLGYTAYLIYELKQTYCNNVNKIYIIEINYIIKKQTNYQKH